MVLHWGLNCFRKTIFFALLVCITIPGQSLLQPGAPLTKEVVKRFDLLATEDPKLRCTFRGHNPRLSYTMQYWAGYTIEVPVKSLDPNPEKSSLNVLIRVVPTEGETRYLSLNTQLPPIPSDSNLRKNTVVLTGGFALGPGKYEVTAIVITDKNPRFCSKSWNISVRQTSNLRIEPNTVSDSVPKWEGLPADRQKKRLTIFLNAAPLVLRRNTVRLSYWDLTAIMGSLTSILDNSDFSHARVVVYSFETQQVLLNEHQFDSRAYNSLVQKLQNLNLGIISVNHLQNMNPVQFMTQLIQQELSQPKQADVVMFLGPVTRHDLKLTPKLRELSKQLPPTVGAFFPSPLLMPYDDIVIRLVSAAKGKRVNIYGPDSLNSVIHQLNEKSD